MYIFYLSFLFIDCNVTPNFNCAAKEPHPNFTMLQSILKLTALLTLLLVVPIAIAAKPIPVPEPGSLSKDIINSLEFFPSSTTPATLFDQSSGEKSLKKSM